MVVKHQPIESSISIRERPGSCYGEQSIHLKCLGSHYEGEGVRVYQQVGSRCEEKQ